MKPARQRERVNIKEPAVLILGFVLAILSAAICMQIMGQFGTAPNTSLIGAALVMIVARIPLMFAKRFRNLERQNYVLSMASSAGFAAANCGFVAIATMFIMGRNDLMLPMAFGALIGSMISVFVIGRIFDSRIFLARGASWPMGQAVATAIEAGDEGGKKGFHLLQGLIVGAVASFFGIPAAGVGIAFIANMITMAALAIGMIMRGYSMAIFGGFDIGQSNIAQGIMIGAGIVALVQIVLAITKGIKKAKGKEKKTDHTISDESASRTMVGSVGLFIGGAVVVAVITGAFSDMPLWQSVLWLVFAGVSSIIIMVLVGTSSMHSGWAPTFAVVTIFLTLGVLIGFPPLSLAVLIGYLGSTGPCLADTGIGLKTGWLIRGKGKDAEHEAQGRRQQIIIKQIGVIVGIGVVVFTGFALVNNGIVPPMSIFYAYTVTTIANPALIAELALWVIPGAILQIAFGSKSVGLMFATGLLINNPLYGIALLASIGLRLVIGTKHMVVRGPGLIAGDGLFGFVTNLIRAIL
ncbi:MAG: OPT/YSL family transporter [Defluviitaleaceae bacterium]|nr:OPT/YSL family transporter [Defluviitaleaceae bacterium]